MNVNELDPAWQSCDQLLNQGNLIGDRRLQKPKLEGIRSLPIIDT